MLKALLFDLDGTLAETDSLHLPTWVDVLAPYGIEVDEEFYRENISGRSNVEIVRDLLPDLSEEEGRGVFEAKEAAFRERTVDLEPLPGLLDFLELGQRLDLTIALVTNAPKENTEAVLIALKLDPYFDLVVLSDDVGTVKPHPAPYRAALEKLGIEPVEAVAFEDSTSGITSAVGACIPTVGIASTQKPAKLREAGAFTTAPDFTSPDLKRIISGEAP